VRKWRSGGRPESLTQFTATAAAASERERLAGKEGHGIGNKISNVNLARKSDFFWWRIIAILLLKKQSLATCSKELFEQSFSFNFLKSPYLPNRF
jgi:hypothetical protein